MSHRVFLHVGLPKSGTSYVQKRLEANRRALEQRGLLFPGRTWSEQVLAVQDVRQMPVPPAKRARVAGAWPRLLEQIADWPGDAMVSMEWLGAASAERIQVIVEDLQPAETHVIFTARDLARTIPAAWQEFVQNRDEWTWPEFLSGVTAEDRASTQPGRRFWAQQDLAALVGTWTSVVPVSDVRVVTLPHPGADRELLWERMCDVIGDAYRDCRAEGAGSNTSLGMESAELMRLLNERARREGMSTPVYQRVFKHRVAKGLLAQRSGEEARVLLTPEHRPWLDTEADRQIEAVRWSGVRVIGDLEELRPPPGAFGESARDQVSADALLDIALGALVGIAEDVGRSAEARRLRGENARLREQISAIERRSPAAILRRKAAGVRRRWRDQRLHR